MFYYNFKRFALLGVAFLAFGLLINYALPPLVRLYIDSQIALTPSSQSYPAWKDIPVPAYQKFYFFNVTNGHEIEQKGHRPKLDEIGPFTYRSEWVKEDIAPDEGRHTLSFKHVKRWHFEPELSVADHHLQLVTLNAPIAITLTFIQSAPNAIRLLVTFSLDGLSEGFFTRRSVKQLLFDGYPDLLTTFGPLLNSEMLSQGGHFGYFNSRNNSQDGQYEVNTGQDNLAKLNTINRFNGRTKLTYWQPYGNCNSLEGATTGEMFPPRRGPARALGSSEAGDSIKLFQPDFCRVWRLDYRESFEQPNEGLRLRRFVATRDIFRNSTDLPENSCYFAHRRSPVPATAPIRNRHSQSASNRIPNPAEERRRGGSGSGSGTGDDSQTGSAAHRQSAQQAGSGTHQHRHHRVRHEWPAGVFTLAPCKFNAPIYISMPHFLDADPYYLSRVEGLAPDPSKHEFFVDLEPRTGSPVLVKVRAQINVAISKPPGLVRFRNVPEMMFPVFWQEFTVNLTGEPIIEQLLLASRRAEEGLTRIACSFLILGAVVLITVTLFYLHLRLASQPEAGGPTQRAAPAKPELAPASPFYPSAGPLPEWPLKAADAADAKPMPATPSVTSTISSASEEGH